MTTTVTLTGTGVPFPSATRAGAGVLVEYGDVRLQFDAGRSTTTRLAACGVAPGDLTALFLTHLHSDHVADVADLALTRWVQDHLRGTGPLPVVACKGRAEGFLSRMFDPYEYDIAVRRAHVQTTAPSVDARLFDLPVDVPAQVWSSQDGEVTVQALAVRHEPVEEAVGYRVQTPDGVVVISGDTRVCNEVESLAEGSDLLVHEACRASALRSQVSGTAFETIFSYHADTVELGAMAERIGVPDLVLTHLIPPPATAQDTADFALDVRRGGYGGRVSVGEDLQSFSLGHRDNNPHQPRHPGHTHGLPTVP